MTCTLCVLHKTCKTVQLRTEGEGRIVFLGENPGEEEDNEGRPFVGRSGLFLRRLISSIGLAESDVRFTNAVRCRPPNNKTPTGKTVKTCLTHLVDEFYENPPEVIVPLGNVALDALRFADLLKIGGKITSLHGKEIVTDDGLVVFPLLNPAYILQNPHASSMYAEAFNKLQNVITNGPSEKSAVHYFCTDRIDELREWMPKFRSTGELSYDIETSCLHPMDAGARILSFAVSWQPNYAFGFVFNDENFREAFDLLHDVLEDESVVKIIQNFKFEMMWSMKFGRRIKNVRDTMLMHWHVDETNGKHGLKRLAPEYTDMGFYDATLENYKDEHPEADPDKGGSYANVPVEMLIAYNCCDADATHRIYKTMVPLLNESQWAVHNDIQIPAAASLAAMELGGVKIDQTYLNDLDAEVKILITEILEELHANPQVAAFNAKRIEQSKKAVNFNSPAQMADLLFKEIGLQPLYATASGKTMSTDSDVLEYLAKKHPVPGLISKLRSFVKLQSTVIEGVRERIKPDGCVHTNYGNAHTETGRYNSSNPNLQNTDDNPIVKNIFIPHGDDLLLQADYSQIEVRIMAAVSKDKALMGFFEEGVDVHRYIASKVFGIPPDQVTKRQRKMAKAVIFGLNYGQSAQGLAEELGIDISEADEFMAKFFQQFLKVDTWIKKTKALAERRGYVETLFGRRRRLPAAMDRYHPQHNEALRQAINAPIQGTAADILSYAQGLIHEYIEHFNLQTRIILTVHDSLVFSIPDFESYLVPIFKAMMETIPFDWMTIPVTVDMEAGPRWGELTKLENEDFDRIKNGACSLSEVLDMKNKSKNEVTNEIPTN